MSLSPVPVESFGGLDLNSDPGDIGWRGAIDLLDVEIDRPGLLRDRRRFSTRVANTSLTTPSVVNWPGQGHIVSTAASLKFYNTGAALIATVAPPVQYFMGSVAAIGTPTTSYLYLADRTNANAIRRLTTGGALSAPAGMPTAKYLARTPNDNRLVAACISGNTSRVQFSDPGAPETWGANNYVDLDPGDGEDIQGVATWRDLTFVFKLTKFYVFDGTSTDSTGNPIFNYRAVRVGIGTSDGGLGLSMAAGPDGLYFYGGGTLGIGIYRTTGGEPVAVSDAIDRALNGTAPSTFSIGNLDGTVGPAACVEGRFFIVVGNTGDTTAYILNYDLRRGQWTIYSTGAANAYISPSWLGHTLYATVTGANAPVHELTDSYTGADSLRTSTPLYRFGFSDLGTPDMKRVHSWRLKGTGTVTLKLSTDFGSLETGASLTLGTSPAVAEAVRRYAPRGRNFSPQVSATGAFTLNSLIAYVAGKRKSA